MPHRALRLPSPGCRKTRAEMVYVHRAKKIMLPARRTAPLFPKGRTADRYVDRMQNARVLARTRPVQAATAMMRKPAAVQRHQEIVADRAAVAQAAELVLALLAVAHTAATRSASRGAARMWHHVLVIVSCQV